ncbi:DNA polymerase III subunit delta' [Histophilus somni]|uniref:DNA polymerase III subunit delta' n=1 Tax=Histophilus somni TaxID=731 RepID=UPI0038778FD4
MRDLYPWLQPYYQQIIQPFLQEKGHHALLFKAEQGIGIEQLIENIAGWLMCRKKDAPQSCRQCQSCALFRAGNHPDFYRLESLDNKDIGVEQVREMNEKVSQFAKQGGNKVVFIRQAERLTESAANALLKTLEEPRPHTYFLLQMDFSAGLLATIYSRCQAWVINTPTEQQGLVWLQQQCQEKIADLQTALRINYNRPLLALDCLEKGLLEQRTTFLRQFWLFYIRRSPLELLPHFTKENVLLQLDWMSAFLHDALKEKLGVRQGWISQDLARGILQFNEKQNVEELLKAIQIIQKMRLNLTQINGVNQELILLEGLTRLVTDVFERKE